MKKIQQKYFGVIFIFYYARLKWHVYVDIKSNKIRNLKMKKNLFYKIN